MIKKLVLAAKQRPANVKPWTLKGAVYGRGYVEVDGKRYFVTGWRDVVEVS